MAVTRVLTMAASWVDRKAVPMAVLRASTMAGSTAVSRVLMTAESWAD